MKKFFYCGFMGWCLEVFWTGLHSLQRRQMRLEGKSSLWMFPIYGLGCLIGPISRVFQNRNVWFRGGIYAICILGMEYLTGSFLKKHHMCPWDYSKAKLNYKGIIRLDYLPVWFLTGLFFEKISLSKNTTP